MSDDTTKRQLVEVPRFYRKADGSIGQRIDTILYPPEPLKYRPVEPIEHEAGNLSELKKKASGFLSRFSKRGDKKDVPRKRPVDNVLHQGTPLYSIEEESQREQENAKRPNEGSTDKGYYISDGQGSAGVQQVEARQQSEVDNQVPETFGPFYCRVVWNHPDSEKIKEIDRIWVYDGIEVGDFRQKVVEAMAKVDIIIHEDWTFSKDSDIDDMYLFAPDEEEPISYKITEWTDIFPMYTSNERTLLISFREGHRSENNTFTSNPEVYVGLSFIDQAISKIKDAKKNHH